MGRWLDRLKQPSLSSDQTGDKKKQINLVQPTEPTKATSVGFVGTVSGSSPKTIFVHREIERACYWSDVSIASLESGLSDDDLEDIRQGLVTAEALADYARQFKSSGYFWQQDIRQHQPRERAPKQQPIPLVETGKASASNAWPPLKRQARDIFIDHIMTCGYCYGPRNRYCESGSKWREFFYSM